MNVKQFQQIQELSTGSTTYINDVFNIMGLDTTDRSIPEVNGMLTTIFDIKPVKFKKKVKIGKQVYYVVDDIMKISFNEWVQYESIMAKAEKDDYIVKNLHKILAIFVRPRRFSWKKLRYTITPFKADDLEAREQEIMKMDVAEAQAINLFFYSNVTDFMKDIKKHYLNEQTTTLAKEINTTETT